MNLLQNISVHGFPAHRAVLALAAALVLSACATQAPKQATPPPLLHAGPEIQVDDVDVLAVTPAMQAFLERYVLPYKDAETRLRLLTLAVTSTGVLGFDYDESLTLTAAEAFRTRSGNCIGFANMMIALARAAGLQASYQQISRRPEWSSREENVLLVKHINVVVSSPQHSYVVDISGIKYKPTARRLMLTDADAKALYFTNLGAEALFDEELDSAWAYLVKAIRTAPSMSDPWVNLGVVFGRNEQLDEAEFAYQAALQINDSEYAAMSNLYEVYLAQENFPAAENLQVRVEKYRQKNPYYLMKLSEESLALGQFEEAIKLLQRAIRKKNDDDLLYFALAKAQYLSGQPGAAQGSLERARELAPQALQVYYSQPLKELVMGD